MKKFTILMLAVVATIVVMVAASSAKKSLPVIPLQSSVTNVQTSVATASPIMLSATPSATPEGFISTKVTADSAAVAGYDRPAGTFLFGFSDKVSRYGHPFVHGPAYTPMTWTNTSTDNYTDFTWLYQNPDFNDTINTTLTATTKDLVAPSYIWSSADGYKLVAKSATLNDTVQPYGAVFLGSSASVNGTDFGSGNFDPTTGSLTRASVISTNAAGAASWKSAYDSCGYTNDSVKVTSFSEFFPAPAHAYELTTVKLWAYITSPSTDAVYNIVVRKVTSVKTTSSGARFPVLGDTLAVGTCQQADVTTPGTNISLLKFPLKVTDNGLEEDADLDINSGIMVTLTAPATSMVKEFYPFWMDGVTDNTASKVTGYVGVDTYVGGVVTNNYTNLTTTWRFGSNPTVYCTHLLFQLDASFNWLDIADDTFTVPVAGGSKDFVATSHRMAKYNGADVWTIAQKDGSVLPDWLTCETTDSTVVESGTTYYSGKTGIKLTAAAQTTGTGRSCDVVFNYPGAGAKVIHVIQGDGSVKGVKANSDVKVAVVGGDFVITHSAAVNSVRVYNVAGQLVGQANLAEGQATVSAANLAKGMYILKFNNNTTVKTIK
jgi:hypothetical protein